MIITKALEINKLKRKNVFGCSNDTIIHNQKETKNNNNSKKSKMINYSENNI